MQVARVCCCRWVRWIETDSFGLKREELYACVEQGRRKEAGENNCVSSSPGAGAVGPHIPFGITKHSCTVPPPCVVSAGSISFT